MSRSRPEMHNRAPNLRDPWGETGTIQHRNARLAILGAAAPLGWLLLTSFAQGPLC